MVIRQRYYLITIASLIIIGLVFYFVTKSQKNALIDQVKKTLEIEKQKAIKEQNEVIQEQEKTINDLIQSNEKAKQQSTYWYNQAKSKQANPNYDIDFLTAADILSKSSYQSGS